MAEEEGWTKEETLKELTRKAGFLNYFYIQDEKISIYLKNNIGFRRDLNNVIEKMEVKKYQSSKFSLHYKDYIKLKN